MSYQDKYFKYKQKYLNIKNKNKNNNNFKGGNQHWGWHLSIDAKNTNDNVKNPDKIKEFGDELITKINMIKYGEPQIIHFGEDDKKGWTYLQLITTSNICCHYCDNNTMYLDIFSCKPFNQNIVIEFIKNFYGTSDINSRFFTRG